MAYNPMHIFATQVLTLIAGFITFVAACVFASQPGMTSGNGFFVVMTALVTLGYAGSLIYYIKNRQGRITYGFALSTTLHLLCLNLICGVWAGSIVESTSGLPANKVTTSARGIVAGNALTIIFQTATLVLLYMNQAIISDESGTGGAAQAQPAGGYQAGAQPYQPENPYTTYEAPVAGGANPAGTHL